MVEKVRQEKCGRKTTAKKCGRKIVAAKVKKKVWQKNSKENCRKSAAKSAARKSRRGRKSVTEKSRLQNATRRKRYGFHMCSVELMNLVEGFPCKSVGCPLGSLGLVVDLM
jgi:hypothetical protein